MTSKSIRSVAAMITVAAILPCGVALASDDAVEAARRFRRDNEARILRDYATMLALPNFGGNLDDITRAAEDLRRRFAARGASMELLQLPGVPPLVVGDLPAPGATRTLGIYVHYDGQAPSGADWVNPPYEPTLWDGPHDRGGKPIAMPEEGEPVDPEWRLYARSASDDRVPFPAMLAALDALQAAGIPRTWNVKFLFEGEEELGSANLGRYLETYGDRLDVDLWLFCDGPVHQSGAPQLVFGVRGDSHLELTVYGPARPLHSGHYGNWAPVPAQTLAELIATFKDDEGNVAVEGFYDSVAPLGREELEALQRLPVNDAELRAELGLGRTEGGGQTLSERLLLPSLTVRGLRSGDVGAAARNVIEDRAVASLDIRLVKGNEPEHMLDLIERHIQAQGFHIVREDPDLETRARYPKLVKVEREEGYPAARSDMGLPIVEGLIEAVQSASERRLLLVPALGGSLPLYLFTESLGRPAVILPIANHDNNQHASNENIRIGNLWYGIDVYAAVLTMR